MSVSEAQRLQLFESAKLALGDHSAEILMNALPTVDYTELVTKRDLDVKFAEFQHRIVTLLVASQGVLLMAMALFVAWR
ncbi:MAG TPA: hypothetical protein VNQ73_06150 [Ilumatobacter sp.]|nr:hypothetical protein [Ilumatobacter sp.]